MNIQDLKRGDRVKLPIGDIYEVTEVLPEGEGRFQVWGHSLTNPSKGIFLAQRAGYQVENLVVLKIYKVIAEQPSNEYDTDQPYWVGVVVAENEQAALNFIPEKHSHFKTMELGIANEYMPGVVLFTHEW